MQHLDAPSMDGRAVGRDWRKRLVVRLPRAGEVERWRELMAAEHYLGDSAMVGNGLRYIATLDNRWVALIGWAAAAWCCGPRDRWIGWAPAMRRRRLRFVANNVRFLILKDVHVPNLASAVLGENARRLDADWRATHQSPLLLAETFVDPARFAGTAYRAAGWQALGRTRGFGRQGGRYVHHGRPKVLWVRPLRPNARALLADPWLAPDRIGGALVSMQALHEMNWSGPGGLREMLEEVADPRKRRGIRHQWVPIMMMAVAALLAGQQTYVEIGEWVFDLPQDILARFGARRVAGGRYQPPSESTFRRVLQRINANLIDAVIGRWFASQGESGAIAVDGKVLRGSGHGQAPVHLLSAFLHQEGLVIGQRAVPDKTNEIPGVPELLADMNIAGKTVTADALHAQVDTASFLVEEKQADYVLQIKANQPTLHDDIQALGPEAFSPSARHH